MSICDDMQALPLPRYLKQHSNEIHHIFNNALGWDYNPKAWRSPVVSANLDIIIQACPKRISRKDVRNFAHAARTGAYEDLRILFLACMIWGYGGDPNGPPNTKLALSDPRAEEVLKGTMNKIANDQIKEAYEEFDLARCGPAFFTKFFYFVGKECAVKPLPLILDRHVANCLRFLGKEEGWELSFFAITSAKGYIKSYSAGYIRYMCTMAAWAKELGCPADNIEYFMYKDSKIEKALGEVDAEGNLKIPIKYCRDGVYCGKCGNFLASPEPGVGFTLSKIKTIVWSHACFHV